jgi:hypothetical protein
MAGPREWPGHFYLQYRIPTQEYRIPTKGGAAVHNQIEEATELDGYWRAHVSGNFQVCHRSAVLYLPATFIGKGANNMYTILLIVLVLLLIGALPTWPYSTGWGYYPSGGLGLVLVIVLVLVLMGRV